MRERARRAARAAAAEAAMELFAAQGFEATTVDQVAEAAGMSKSSFFRYFASKDGLVIDRVELLSDELGQALAARPLAEAAWDALHGSFEAMLSSYADAFERRRAATFFKVIGSSPVLSAAYLERLDRLEQRLTDILRERATLRGEEAEPAGLLTRATVGAALACLKAIFPIALACEDRSSAGVLLGMVMDALRPGGGADAPALAQAERRLGCPTSS